MFPYFTPKLFCFLCTQFLVCPRAFSTYLLVEFPFFILECFVLIVFLDPVSVSFKFPFFRQYLLIYLFKLKWPCRLGLQNTWVRLPNLCPEFDIKQSDGEDPVMLELWGMRGTLLLPSLLGPLWLRAPDRVLSTGQIERKYLLMLDRIV